MIRFKKFAKIPAKFFGKKKKLKCFSWKTDYYSQYQKVLSIMDKLNLKKLVNLKKRFEKYVDCNISNDIVSIIDKHIEIEKEKSKQKDMERRIDYQNESVICEWCSKFLCRKSLYNHKKCCLKRPSKTYQNNEE